MKSRFNAKLICSKTTINITATKRKKGLIRKNRIQANLLQKEELLAQSARGVEP